MQQRKLIFLCSPYSSTNSAQHHLNIQLAELCCLYIVRQGYVPLAPHLLYTTFLDDRVSSEREAGIECGLTLLAKCDEMWLPAYGGLSDGMQLEMDEADRLKIPKFHLHPRLLIDTLTGDPRKPKYKLLLVELRKELSWQNT